MEQELDLHEIWQAIIKRWVMILLIPLLAAAASALISIYVITPQYKAETTLLVSTPPDTPITIHDVQLSRQLVDTYREIARSNAVLNEVAANLQLPYSISTLRDKVEVGSVRNTEVIKISAADPDPALAQDIANELAAVFMKEVVERYKVENVSFLDWASLPLSPVTPRVLLNIIVTFIIGLMVALGLVFLLEYLDNTIKEIDDVQKHLNLPVLGIIPEIEDKG